MCFDKVAVIGERHGQLPCGVDPSIGVNGVWAGVADRAVLHIDRQAIGFIAVAVIGHRDDRPPALEERVGTLCRHRRGGEKRCGKDQVLVRHFPFFIQRVWVPDRPTG